MTREEMLMIVDERFSPLTFMDREILKLRHGIGDGYVYTLDEVCRIFKVTKKRIQQIEAKAERAVANGLKPRKTLFTSAMGLTP